MKEMQELHCHNCLNYVQFEVDMELNGNHVLKCPKCGHEHCRVVKDGVITEDRWDSRNPTIPVTNATYTAISTWTNYTSSSTNISVNITSNASSAYVSTNDTARSFLYGSWMNTLTTN